MGTLPLWGHHCHCGDTAATGMLLPRGCCHYGDTGDTTAMGDAAARGDMPVVTGDAAAKGGYHRYRDAATMGMLPL